MSVGTNQLRLANGDVITTKAYVSFVGPVPPNGAPKRREPIDPRDRITIGYGGANPLTGVIVENPGGGVDPETGRPYANVVWLK